MRGAPGPKPWPWAQLAFALAILIAAGALGWASGRTMAVVTLLRPLWVAQSWVAGGLGELGAKVGRWRQLERQRADLNERVAALESQLAAYEEQLREAQRLRGLVALPWPSGVPRRVARLIARAPDAWHLRAVLDVGRQDGVAPDSVLVTKNGVLVGRVQSSGERVSVAQLMGDPAAAVAVLNARTRAPGVAQGSGGPRLALRFVDRPEAWKAGDRIISSGLGGIYPKGLLVGRLVAGTPGLDGEAAMLIEPAADLSGLEEVLVLPPGLKALPAPSPRPDSGASAGPAASASPKPRPSP